MSTRATYTFLSANCTPEVSYYIHHDGYPSGAAEYFREAMRQTNRQGGGIAASFMRANQRAEFTKGRDAHCDTEYHWVVDGMQITGYVRDSRDTWRLVCKGSLLGFVNGHAEDGDELIQAEGMFWQTDELIEAIGDGIEEAEAIKAKGWIGNAGVSLSQAERMLEALAQACPDHATIEPLQRVAGEARNEIAIR